MKASRFNEILEYQDKTLAFNAMTCAFAEIDQEFLDILDDAKLGKQIDTSNDLVKDMIFGGYLIEDNFNEVSALRFRSLKSKFDTNGLGLTIAPTLACNFACPYCYEEAQAGFMKEDIQTATLDFIRSQAHKINHLNITWYGGEPLLALNIIRKLSKSIITICKECHITYDAFMISNCYLITPDIAKELHELRVSGVQVTIDGPRDVHNKRRKLKVGSDDTYTVILKNVRHLRDAGINVYIRVNIDKTNSKYVEELLDDLASYGLQDCVVNFGHVNAYTEACANIESNCLSVEAYALETLAYQSLLYERGFQAQEYPNYPGIKGNYCCADALNGFVLDYQGNLYKCWNDIGNLSKTIGNILTPNKSSISQFNVLQSYMLWSPFEHDKCLQCSILPICMGGCPFNGLEHDNEPECEKWKYNMLETLIKVYEQQ